MDGEATRARILETAGQLFAERGYADTTSKAICERAQCNMAAVNYHFGSRDGLYLSLLKEVHKHLISLDYLARLAHSAQPPRQKLEAFLDGLTASLLNSEGWHIRLWAREVLAPSPHLAGIIEAEALPKFGLISAIIGEITGIPPGDPALTRCVLSVMAPCMMLLVIHRDMNSPIQAIFEQPAEVLASHLKTYALAGLDAIVAARAAPVRSKRAR
ncbi:TetR/AcrR family transcriptional regulator [Pigmentiphaga sp. NML080357]|uniref:TetR/AcrR family transcriptional regulator n=1 Tax=Pigmentiphaga sp. NML080357 TaxID=2008675 RepID=UPI001E4638B9|nr:CerR family C-terminal domain-containing protein [Pigmentiphaga sp. NML080357]